MWVGRGLSLCWMEQWMFACVVCMGSCGGRCVVCMGSCVVCMGSCGGRCVVAPYPSHLSRSAGLDSLCAPMKVNSAMVGLVLGRMCPCHPPLLLTSSPSPCSSHYYPHPAPHIITLTLLLTSLPSPPIITLTLLPTLSPQLAPSWYNLTLFCVPSSLLSPSISPSLSLSSPSLHMIIHTSGSTGLRFCECIHFTSFSSKTMLP